MFPIADQDPTEYTASSPKTLNAFKLKLLALQTVRVAGRMSWEELLSQGYLRMMFEGGSAFYLTDNQDRWQILWPAKIRESGYGAVLVSAKTGSEWSGWWSEEYLENLLSEKKTGHASEERQALSLSMLLDQEISDFSGYYMLRETDVKIMGVDPFKAEIEHLIETRNGI